MASFDEALVLIALREAFVAGADRPLSVATRIEVALDEGFRDDEEVREYITIFASYRPEGGEYLYDAEQIVPRCRTLLRILKGRLT